MSLGRMLRAGCLAVACFALGCAGGGGDSSWQPVQALDTDGWWMDVSASPTGSVWAAVGGRPDRGALWMGKAPEEWQPQALPEVPLLNWVQLFDTDRGMAVGNGGTALLYEDGRWHALPTPTEQDLWGVWGASPEDVWLVGGAGRKPGQATLMHYDGAEFCQVSLPELERPNVWALFKVWGSAADDVWVVGQHGVILHYDGDTWSEFGAGTGEDLIALWGVGPERIVAVGGRSSGVVATFDGTRWRSRSLAPLPGLNGVWTGDGETVFVSGIEGTLAQLDFDSLEYEEQYQDTSHTFHAVHGANGRVLSVGGNLGATRPPYESVARVRRWRGGK